MAMTCLPTIPLVIFGVVEPALLVWAYITAMNDPFKFYADQAQTHKLSQSDFTPQAQIMTYQTVNVYMLLAALAVVCSWTQHASVAKLYLAAVALADWGHIWSCCAVLPYDLITSPSEWNDMLWGSVGVSVFLNVFRLATLADLLGAVRDAAGEDGKEGKRA